MKKILLIIIFFGVFSNTFGQDLEGIKITFNNAEVTEDRIEKLETAEFGILFQYNFNPLDTLKVYLYHHLGKKLYSSTGYRFTNNPGDFLSVNKKNIKAGDELTFEFRVKDAYFQKTFKVISTTASLTKPYYLDIYFILNQDTISTDKFSAFFFNEEETESEWENIMQIRRHPVDLKYEKKDKFIRFFYNNPKELGARVGIIHKEFDLGYDFFSSVELYHGKIVIEYNNKKKLIKRDNYNKVISITDLDTGNSSGRRQMRHGRYED